MSEVVTAKLCVTGLSNVPVIKNVSINSKSGVIIFPLSMSIIPPLKTNIFASILYSSNGPILLPPGILVKMLVASTCNSNL